MKIDLRGINVTRKRLANGTIKAYYYHRATALRLRGEPGSAQFIADYESAESPVARDAGTVAGLIREYLGSPKFAKKRGTTQREYKRMLTKLEMEFGTMPVLALGSAKVVGKFIDYQEEIGRHKPREATIA